MPHTIRYNSALGIIETQCQGVVTIDEIREICSEVNQLAREHNCFMTLGDYREAKVNLTTFEIFQLPKLVAEISAPFGLCAAEFKRAFVFRSDTDDFRFFETVTLNSGQNARLFQTADEARKWLVEEPPSSQGHPAE